MERLSTLDTSNGNIYVANCFENDVSVINSVTNMLVKGNSLYDCAVVGFSDFYDPSNGLLYYSDANGGQLLIPYFILQTQIQIM